MFDEQSVDCGRARRAAIVVLAMEDNSRSMVVFDDQGWDLLTPAAAIVPDVVGTLKLQEMVDERDIDYEMVAIAAALVLAEDIQKVRMIDE